MAIKFKLVKAGDQLYDVHRTKMGNTTASRWGTWPVEIISINHAEGWAMVRWNFNTPERWYRRQIERLRRSPHKDDR